MCLLGESTLALDEEILQVLDAVEPVKPANNSCPKVVKAAREEPSSLAVFSDPTLQSTGLGLRRTPTIKDCRKPRLRDESKDLAQRLLFSEDSQETGHAQGNAENTQSVQISACVNGLSCQRIISPQEGISTQ